MKQDLKTATTIAIIGLLIFTAQACNKYEDGPLISLRSREERIANTWKVDNYKKNDVDYTSLVGDYTETFTKDGNYNYNWGSFAGNGTWALQNNDEEIQITGINNQSNTTIYILKLEEEVFWYYYMDGSDKEEFHMIQQ